MAKIYKLKLIKNTRLYLRYSLVFFLLAGLAACKNQAGEITLRWKDRRATAIQIPKYLIKDAFGLRLKHSVKVVLAGKSGAGILGDFVLDGYNVVFQPLIPLSPGMGYEILQDGRMIGKIQVPLNRSEQAPQLVTIYPEGDTLPENQLKFYFKFSKPMRTGQSLDYICLLDQHRDTMHNVFLNLQPELWDTSGTVLTLWLDPGRIKRGLVLNHELGNPLKKAEAYELIVSQRWKDSRGLNLSKKYSRKFVAGERSQNIIDIKIWGLNVPKPQSKYPLIINTHEPLDHYLLLESIAVVDNNGKLIKGIVDVSNKDQTWKFTPSEPWKAGHYKLQVRSNLEDLAGNNLNRVFDRDITKDKQKNYTYYKRDFELKP